MKRMPIPTSGRLLVQRGIISAPLDDDGSDWAELAVVEVDDQDASFPGSYDEAGYPMLASPLCSGSSVASTGPSK
jgi:hypothetical protein